VIHHQFAACRAYIKLGSQLNRGTMILCPNLPCTRQHRQHSAALRLSPQQMIHHLVVEDAGGGIRLTISVTGTLCAGRSTCRLGILPSKACSIRITLWF
jgi:hypothetical protein